MAQSIEKVFREAANTALSEIITGINQTAGNDEGLICAEIEDTSYLGGPLMAWTITSSKPEFAHESITVALLFSKSQDDYLGGPLGYYWKAYPVTSGSFSDSLFASEQGKPGPLPPSDAVKASLRKNIIAVAEQQRFLTPVR
jgi:hypothetical protein